MPGISSAGLLYDSPNRPTGPVGSKGVGRERQALVCENTAATHRRAGCVERRAGKGFDERDMSTVEETHRASRVTTKLGGILRSGTRYQGNVSDEKIAFLRGVWLPLVMFVGLAGAYLVSEHLASERVARGQTDVGGSGLSDATTIQLGSSISTNLSSIVDEDFFKLVLSEETDVAIFIESSDTVRATLLDTEGADIEYNDSGRFIINPKHPYIRRTLGAGVYYIKATTNSTFGATYTLRTKQEGAGSNRMTAESITLGRPTIGRLDSTDDADYFKITTTAAKAVAIYTVSQMSLKGEIFGTGETAIAEDGDSDGEDFLITHTLPAGTHYIKVTSPASEMGPYGIHVAASTPQTNWLSVCRAIETDYNDPLFGCQWFLKNSQQNTGSAGQDINVVDVWAAGNTGQGVVVVVADSAFDPLHEDLNVDAERLKDLSGVGYFAETTTSHGVGVAGVIGASANNLGGRGVAPGVTLGGHNVLDTSSLRSRVTSLTHNMSDTQIHNNSWGDQQSAHLYPASRAEYVAVQRGITEGNGGKGVMYVWAAANGHERGMNATSWEYNTHHGVTTVCAINDKDKRATYSNRGANLWICAPSSEDATPAARYEIVTTDNLGQYTRSFGGTSSAAPVISGVAALIRKADPDLTWRDVKLILAASARKVDPTHADWEQGASKYRKSAESYNFNHDYGFGTVDAKAAIDLVADWQKLPPFTSDAVSNSEALNIPQKPSGSDATTVTSTVDLSTDIEFLEYVEISIDIEHRSLRDVEIKLTSPSTKTSELLPAWRPQGNQVVEFPLRVRHRFASTKHLGENPSGRWTLSFTDKHSGGSIDSSGTLHGWKLEVFGHQYKPSSPSIARLQSADSSLKVVWEAPHNAGDSEITGYDLRYIRSDASDKSDANWTVQDDVWTTTSTSQSYTLAGLSNGVAYDVQMRATNSTGDSAWSQTTKETPVAVSDNARLSELSLSDIVLDQTFSSETRSYTAVAANSVTRTTVTAVKYHDSAAISSITPGDADNDSTNGHQVNLSEGVNTISVNVSAQDGTTSLQYTIRVRRQDATVPTVSLSTEATSPQNDEFEAKITFSEAMVGFELSDIYVEHGTLNNLETTDNTTYTVTVVPHDGWIGRVSVDVSASVATDSTGNPNQASPLPLDLNVDTVPPEVSIQLTDLAQDGTAFDVEIVFYEAAGYADPVTGFTQSDITVANGTLASLVALTLGVGDGAIENVAWTATINLPAVAACDTTMAINQQSTCRHLPPVCDPGSTQTYDPQMCQSTTPECNLTTSINSQGTCKYEPPAEILTLDVASGAVTDAAGNNNVAALQFSGSAESVGSFYGEQTDQPQTDEDEMSRPQIQFVDVSPIAPGNIT